MSQASKKYDVLIVGGGYSGCIAAIILARRNMSVALIEQNELLARKILSTGNGRCNFTNDNMSKENFYSESSLDSFCFNSSSSIDFFRELGVIEKNINGYYYPITNQAKTVRDAIEFEINSLNIDVFLNTKIKKINKVEDGFICCSDKDFCGRNLILATGGLAAPALGSSGDGIYFAKQLGLKITPLGPALVGCKSNDSSLKGLAGVRTNGTVTFENNSCEGEIQFNKDGISGYPLMCISRFIGLAEPFDSKELSVDFVPFFNGFVLEKELEKRVNKASSKRLIEALNGLCNDKVLELIIKIVNLSADCKCSTIEKKDVERIAKKLKNCSFTINGTKGYANAQVTAGGVNLDEINLSSMMVKDSKLKGLYVVGELCDVDGICGGYNLTWALESAFKAANAILDNQE